MVVLPPSLYQSQGCSYMCQAARRTGLLPETWSSWTVSFVECEREESGP